MKIFFKKFLIVFGVLSIIGFIYFYALNEGETGSPVKVAYGGSLVSSSGEVSPLLGDEDSQVIADISFLNTLESLKKLRIDNSFFSSQSFTRLNDNTVPIDPIPAGRTNPFASIDTKNIPRPSDLPDVITEQATEINKESAILNGFVNVATGVKDIYFEYGLTQAFGSQTVMLKQSLVGNFSKIISGLTPGTKYFYRSVAEINGTKIEGEIMSFTTAQ